MGTAIRLGDDFDAALLRALAKTGCAANQIRRLFALAEIYDDGSRGDAATPMPLCVPKTSSGLIS